MSTRLIRSYHHVPQRYLGGVVTIGNFDGVHLGHQALLKKLKEKAAELHVPSVVITFEPHAFEFFGQNKPRITRFREKFYALAACGIEAVMVLPFDQRLADLSANDFVTRVLQQGLQAKHIIVGDDFHFGKGREGDIHLLEQLGHIHQFGVESMQTVLGVGERISSTRLRDALLAGNQPLAEQLLGHPYTMMGRIRHGDKLGRQLGFPTANIFLHRRQTPVKGIYTVYMHGITPLPLPGVANVGTRPTVDGTTTLLEVHLLDFNDVIYGRYVTIEFCKKLRDEERYPNLQLLQAQIARDVEAARVYFKNR